MFEHALIELPPSVLGLDIGCAWGDLTVDRFGGLPAVQCVLGLDKNEACIARANEAFGEDPRWRFVVLDVERADAEDELAKLLASIGSNGPMLVLMAFVLNHLTEPIRLLNILRSTLPSGSKIIIRTSDDGTKLNSPDPEGRLAFILEMTNRAPGIGDQLHGRKVFSQLYAAGFRDVRMFAEPILLPNMSPEEREMLFDVHFSHRINQWEEAAATGTLSSTDQADIERLKKTLCEYKLDLANPSHFFFETLFGAVATVP
jgi:hypothetical protein